MAECTQKNKNNIKKVKKKVSLEFILEGWQFNEKIIHSSDMCFGYD